ncbi:hypothetical protein AB1L30_05815 [Bremerella sp. JC817]|uniref:hypothetical protein n=1 Tax=Bremerella sp. JC817 TaxID=3231756 RepID=UPI003459223A
MNTDEEPEKIADEPAPVQPTAYLVTVSLALIAVLALQIGYCARLVVEFPVLIGIAGFIVLIAVGLLVAQYLATFRHSSIATLVAIVLAPLLIIHGLPLLIYPFTRQFAAASFSVMAILQLLATGLAIISLMVNANWLSILSKARKAGEPIGRVNAFTLYELLGITAVLALVAFPFGGVGSTVPGQLPVQGSGLSKSEVPFDTPIGATQIHFLKLPSGEVVAEWIAHPEDNEQWVTQIELDSKARDFDYQQAAPASSVSPVPESYDPQSILQDRNLHGANVVRWTLDGYRHEVQWVPDDPEQRTYYHREAID